MTLKQIREALDRNVEHQECCYSEPITLSDIQKLLKVAEAAKAYMSDDGFVNVLYYHAFEALRQALKELEGE